MSRAGGYLYRKGLLFALAVAKGTHVDVKPGAKVKSLCQKLFWSLQERMSNDGLVYLSVDLHLCAANFDV